MSRSWLPFAILGGVVGGALLLLTRKPTASASLPPPPPPAPPRGVVEVQKAAQRVDQAKAIQEAVAAQVANLEAAAKAASANPAAQKALEDAKQKLVAATQTTKAANTNLVVKAATELAKAKVAEIQASAGPMYPKGLTANFSGNTAVIKDAWQDGQKNWHYKIDLDHPLLIGSIKLRDKAVSEAYLREKLAKEGNIVLQPGQAFAPGIEIFGKNGQGGAVLKAEKNASGEWQYQFPWGTVSQRELLGILTR